MYYVVFRVYLDSNLEVGEADSHIKACCLDLVGLEMRNYGATLSDQLDNKVSHVIVDSKDISRVASLRDISKTRAKKFHIVTQDWVSDCIKSEKLLQERVYEPDKE